MRDFDLALRDRLDTLDRQGRRRFLRPVERLDGRVLVDGRALIDFSSNDSLGLADHPDLKRRAGLWAERFGAGATASRLVCGGSAAAHALEARIAALKRFEAALILASGFQANGAVLAALLDRRVAGAEPMVFADRLAHASMHHGIAAAGLRQIRYRHGDLDHLDALLTARRGRAGLRLIVTETVFSMDGDVSDVAALVALARRHGALLYLDEAHATGVMGPGGAGLGAGADIVMGTFGKALGGFGAYVACSALLRDWLVNACGGLIYSTAPPPAVLGAIEAALDLLPGLEPERAKVAALAERLRGALRGFDTGRSASHIVPVILGDEARALEVARGLEARGFLAIAIRPPTVPTARLRLSVSARHTPEQIDALALAIIELAG
ncbi:MAG: 8-amino-7-oxononanoate synthase [Alphaproteobacteria bacterium]|nr:8-amino-7-oxononanoate synthase [Alphaproteobacteria bacterium]